MQEFAAGKTIAQRMALRPLNCLFRKYRMAVRIMKLTTFILLAACLQLSARGISQTVTISVKDAPLLKVLKAIEKQTDFVFFVSSDELKRAKNVSITAKNLPLQQVLDLCFKDQPLTYTITGKLINVVPRLTQVEKNDKATFGTPLPQNKDINGVIIDENGSPAQGVNITVKGTGKGTSTNFRGEFQLKDVDENAYLVITSVGYDKVEVSVKEKSFLSVQLRIAIGTLDQMQVVAYGTTSKRFSTGNVSTVKAADIENQPYENPVLALEGRVPGIQITQLAGLPGSGTIIRIQGRNSIKSGLEPLYIVDGVPYPPTLLNTGLEYVVQGGSPLNYLNPNDIESIDVLKDADATAIYGSRAANGAILITTKKGKAGKSKISFNVQQGWGRVGHFADMMNTRQYLDMRYEALKNDGLSPDPAKDYDLTLWDTTRYTNWQKEVIGGTAKFTNINTSFSGGNNLFQYLIGGNYNKQSTVFPGSFADKKGGAYFNFSGSSSNQKFKAQFSGNYTYDQNNLPGYDLTQTAVWMEPDAPALYDKNGHLNWAPDASGSSSWWNPLANIFYNKYNNTTKNLTSNLTLRYQVLPKLDLRCSLGYNNIESDFILPTMVESYPPEYLPYVQRQVQYGQRNMTSWILEPQLHYSSRIWKGKLDALIGGTVQQSKAEVMTFTGTGYSTDLLMQTLTAATAVTPATSGNSQTKFNALFGRLNYVVNDKYIVDFTARRDGSSKFGDNNKLHSFGSVAGAWIISGEKWVQNNLSFLSFAKLRSSYGITGNDQIGDFNHLSTYGIPYGTGILYQGGIGLNPLRIPNPNLQWEETRKWQSGIDLGFFSDRILLGVTYARNRSSNQIVSYPLPTTTGFTDVKENLPALIQNTSLEFTLQTTNIKKKNLSWNTSFNLTIPRNKLLRFPGIENTQYADGTNGVIVGQSLGVIKALRYAGVDPATGYYTVYNANGHITPNPDYNTDRTVLLSNLVKFYGGIQNAIQYKSFQLDVNFQFVQQRGPNDMYYNNGSSVSYYPAYFIGSGNGNQPVGIIGNHWQKPGDNSTFAQFSTVANTFWPALSDVWYSYNASYIRVKNVSLSWTLPKKMLKDIGLQNLVLYFRGDNVFTFTKYKGLDPENIGVGSLPPLRVLTLGLKVDL